MNFSYAAAYLNNQSNALFNDLGVSKQNLHMTLCFDKSATISIENNIDLKTKTATIKSIKKWNTSAGPYIVAELDNCVWSEEINAQYLLLGAQEDFPHNPHITLDKNGSTELIEKLQSLLGKEITFDKFIIKSKTRLENNQSSKLKL